MQKKINKYIMTFRLALISTVLGSIPIAFIPLADFNGSTVQKVIAYCIGEMFWLFTVAGYVLFCISLKQKRDIAQNIKTAKRNGRKIGLICFFSTPEGSLADGLLIVSAVMLVMNMIVFKNVSWYGMISVTLFMLSAQLHCILNGDNFKYKKYLQLRRVKNAYKNED